jgi:glutamate-1-semialdehyde 2,1-aminomutase
MFSMGSIFWVSFDASKAIRRMDEINETGVKRFAPFHKALLERGVYLGPSGYEVGFISQAHTNADIEMVITAMQEALDVAYQAD